MPEQEKSERTEETKSVERTTEESGKAEMTPQPQKETVTHSTTTEHAESNSEK